MAKVFYAQRLPSETIAAIKILSAKLGVSEATVLVRAVAEFIPGERAVKQPRPVLNKPASPTGRGAPILKPSAKSL